MIAGTFDILHPGHIFFINEAAKLGDVYVIVATDKNSTRFKGHSTTIPEEQRLKVIQSIKNVKEARLGNHEKDTIKTVVEINPDIILLGPDQKFSIESLKKGMEENELNHVEIRRLDEYNEKYSLYSSSLIKKKILEQYKVDK